MLDSPNFSTFEFVPASTHLCGVMRLPVLFLLLFVALGCNRTEKTVASPLYFDLPGYFADEINRQHGHAIRAEVHWEKDGVTERQTGVLIDWHKSFSALKKLDMNKTAYRGSYRCDTLTEKGIVKIHYQALTETVNPKTVQLELEAGLLRRLEIKTADKNFLYSSEVYYTYVPDDTLRISGTQQVFSGKTHSYQRSYWY